MLSVCGLLCSMLRGWRHSEAVVLMAKALGQPHSSLLIQDLSTTHTGKVTMKEPCGSSSFCLNSGEDSLGQLLWRDNNKQAVIISPKQCVDLQRWTLFLSHTDHPLDLTRRGGARLRTQTGSSSNDSGGSGGSSGVVSTGKETVTVLLEASYRDREDDPDTGNHVMVEHLSQPYAWKARDLFGVIVVTTPPQLLAMIQAFFNNALLIDDDLLVKKILSIEVVGQPATLDDPLSIPQCVTPGPWNMDKITFTQMELARCVSPLTLPGLREIAASNPSLQQTGSPYLKGLPHSSSFTSSPFRRPHSSAALFSPAKRNLSSTSGGGAGDLMRVEEEGPSRKNVDAVTEKPPNVLVYAANNTHYFTAVKDTLLHCLNPDRYTVYQLTDELAFKSPWSGSTTLLVVCGDVPAHISTKFIRYLLQGGRVLSICSDFLNMAVPLFGTVEVQEEAVVSVSYGRWSSVQLLHHQHCFHSSPKHKRFSQDLDKHRAKTRSAVSVEPTHVEIIDEYGTQHRLNLQVLATDDTWGAPSLLAALVHGSSGTAVFSQVHLERDGEGSSSGGQQEGSSGGGQQEGSSGGQQGARQAANNQARLEILRDLLSAHLSLDTTLPSTPNLHTPAYFLGKHEMKEALLSRLQPHLLDRELLKRPHLTLQFVGPGTSPSQASDDLLPILLNACPSSFSTVRYFETLRTEAVGRLVVYSDVMSSSMRVMEGFPPLLHGIAVLPTQQTHGKGRTGNSWLSPLGCAMFSVQLHLTLSSHLGQHLSFLQHLVSLAVVQAVRELPGYQDIPLHLKWPNDIYLGTSIKIGGVIVEASTAGKEIIANIGCGINLSNSNPTCCINDAIRRHNQELGTRLPELDRETFLARVFNALENLINTFQHRGPGAVQPLYYKYWLHSNATVTVQNELRQTQSAVLVGVDNFGFLEAQLSSGATITLHPDGNSFNMMEGLVYSKTN